jgi:hypothetical protein
MSQTTGIGCKIPWKHPAMLAIFSCHWTQAKLCMYHCPNDNAHLQFTTGREVAVGAITNISVG